MRRIVLAAVLSVAIALPALAHTDAELSAWLADWSARADTLTPLLVDEYREMAVLHPCRLTACPQPQKRAVDRRLPAAPSHTAWGGNVEQWRPLVALYWPAELVEWALRIMACESGGNPWAENPRSSAAGLYQFLRSTWDRGPAPALGLGSYDSGAVYDPESNIRAAAWLYQNWGGESQWTCKA